MEITDIKKVAEVNLEDEETANRAIRYGWVLLGIASKRNVDFTLTRYVLGSTDINAVKPYDIPVPQFYIQECGCDNGWRYDDNYDHERCPRCEARFKAEVEKDMNPFPVQVKRLGDDE